MSNLTQEDILKKLSQNHELIFTSFHEAGHTICALLHYMSVPMVTISLTEHRAEGYTHYNIIEHQNIIDPEILNYFIISEINISYAGLVCEKILNKSLCGSDNFPILLREGSSPDILNASTLIKKNNLALPGKPRSLFKKRILKELSQLLQNNWDDVRLIAHLLYRKKKINYDDLRTLLTKKSLNKIFWRERFREIDILTRPSGITEEDLRFVFFKGSS
jgi:hypothetical protein